MSRKQTLIRGTAVLTLTSFLTRFMGFFYRIFLSHTFGEEKVGLYQLVFPVYALGISLSCAGTQLALSRCVAKETASGHPERAEEFLKSALLFTLLVSCLLTVFLQKNAGLIARSFLHDERCEPLLILLSYAFPFASIHSCICGYYLGLKKTRVSCLSQLLEQIVRIFSVLFFCFFAGRSGMTLSVSFAVAGLCLGEVFSSLYCLYFIQHSATDHPGSSGFSSRSCSSACSHAFILCRRSKELFGHALPLTASRVMLNILQSIEAVSIPLNLQYYGMSPSRSLKIYGVLTGMALPCILFPSAVTNAVSSMLLPAIAEVQEKREYQKLRTFVYKSICSCIFLGAFCCLFLFLFGKWIGLFLFRSTLAGTFILTLSWICPFLYTNTVLLSMINGLGKTTFSFLVNLLSLAIRIGAVFLCIPVSGIGGYLRGLLVSQIFLFLACILRLFFYIRTISHT